MASLSMSNSNSARKSRAASHLTRNKCSAGRGHMRLQLLDTVEGLGAGISKEIYSPIGFQTKFSMKNNCSSKNKNFRHVKPTDNNFILQGWKFCTCMPDMLPTNISKLSFLFFIFFIIFSRKKKKTGTIAASFR